MIRAVAVCIKAQVIYILTDSRSFSFIAVASGLI